VSQCVISLSHRDGIMLAAVAFIAGRLSLNRGARPGESSGRRALHPLIISIGENP
jgi:hypothetical protein